MANTKCIFNEVQFFCLLIALVQIAISDKIIIFFIAKSKKKRERSETLNLKRLKLKILLYQFTQQKKNKRRNNKIQRKSGKQVIKEFKLIRNECKWEKVWGCTVASWKSQVKIYTFYLCRAQFKTLQDCCITININNQNRKHFNKISDFCYCVGSLLKIYNLKSMRCACDIMMGTQTMFLSCILYTNLWFYIIQVYQIYWKYKDLFHL